MVKNEFSKTTVQKAWGRSGGKCECKRQSHINHRTDCKKLLAWRNRGRKGYGCWEAHHLDPDGEDILSNCEILCWDCHEPTF